MNTSNFAEMYERCLVGPLFRPWAQVMLQRMELTPGDRVLDIACGTGILARMARQQLGGDAQVVGIDLNPQMLAVARTIAPDIEWREGSAAALPVPAGETFEAVVCQQGLQFFADKPAAAREMRRVTAPAGRLAVATWRALEEAPFLMELHRVAERHLGPVIDRRHGFADANGLERLLADAGFREVRVETLSLTMRLPDPALFVSMNATALAGMSSAAATMDDARRAAVAAAIASDSSGALLPWMDGEELAFDISTNLATARA